MKLYYLVRKDLEVSKGKLIVHAGHATDTIFWPLIARKNGKEVSFLIRWADWYYKNHQTKIVLSVKNMKQLIKFINKADKLNIPSVMVSDKGFYEVEEGTVVMGAIGPLNETEKIKIGLDKLSLYKG